jgi:hypothetical protein
MKGPEGISGMPASLRCPPSARAAEPRCTPYGPSDLQAPRLKDEDTATGERSPSPCHATSWTDLRSMTNRAQSSSRPVPVNASRKRPNPVPARAHRPKAAQRGHIRSTAAPRGSCTTVTRPERSREQCSAAWSLAALPGADRTLTSESVKGPSGTCGDNRPYVTSTPS